MTVNEKICPRCKASKTITEFDRNKTASDGCQSECKVCKKRRAAEYNSRADVKAKQRGDTNRKVRRKQRDCSPEGMQRRREYDREYRKRLEVAKRLKEKRSTDDEKRKKRDRELRRKYGITQTDYDDKWIAQGGVCTICQRGGRTLFVDHDHGTGAVRGLLCSECNSGLGYFEENTKALERAINYLSVPEPQVWCQVLEHSNIIEPNP